VALLRPAIFVKPNSLPRLEKLEALPRRVPPEPALLLRGGLTRFLFLNGAEGFLPPGTALAKALAE
jgi:hypothetical protein